MPGRANDPVIALESNGNPRRDVNINARARLIGGPGVQRAVELRAATHMRSAKQDLRKGGDGRERVRGNPRSAQVGMYADVEILAAERLRREWAALAVLADGVIAADLHDDPNPAVHVSRRCERPPGGKVLGPIVVVHVRVRAGDLVFRGIGCQKRRRR